MPTTIQSKWLKHLLSTEPSDRPRAEAALATIYSEILQLPAPRFVFWFDSPEQAGWTVKLLGATHENLWRAFVENKSTEREGRLFLENLRAELCARSGLDWDSLTQAAGRNRTQQCPFQSERIKLHGLMEVLRQGWNKGHPLHSGYLKRVRPLLSGPPKDGEVARVEHLFQSTIHKWSGLLLSLNYNENGAHYTFAAMAVDEEAAATEGTAVPPAIAAAWELAQSAGPCWVFEGAAVILERPIELRFNANLQLHCDDGPAGAFRDGTKIWAWNGKASNEEYILHPEKIRPSLWKELAPEFVERIKARRAALGLDGSSGTVGKANAALRKAFGKRTSVFEKNLPAAIQDRLATLRAHNRGSLPLLDRYLAGEHEPVWRDLVALGSAVREDPHAADVLAVAYETMRRVERNVRTVSDRLRQAGFSKEDGALYTPPKQDVSARIRELEKVTGTLPVSLRAFYEIVGSVDWMGKHTELLPARSTLCPDPFVVVPIEAALEMANAYCDDWGDEKWVLIAPDALHKADTSGGDPYQIEVPNETADGELLFGPHGLNFVEYLRLVFQFGGFPGYEGVEHPPAQLADLRAHLLAF